MKISQLIIVSVAKVCFILFGIIPLVSVVLFGAIPVFPTMQSVINWAGTGINFGFVLFLSYLVVAIISTVSKNKMRYSSIRNVG